MNEKKPLSRAGIMGDLIGQAVANLKPDQLPQNAAPQDSPVIEIAPDKVKMNELHRRMNITMQGAALEELVASIKHNGQQQEAKGWKLPRPDADGTEVILIYGARRRAAAMHLGVSLRVRLVDKPTTVELMRQMHSENRGRKDYLPLEQAKEFKAYLDEGTFKSPRELAAGLGENEATVSRLLSLLKLPKDVLTIYTDPSWLPLHNGAKLASAIENDKAAGARVTEAAKAWRESGGRGNPTPTLLKAAQTKPVAESVSAVKDKSGHDVGTIRQGVEGKSPFVINLGKQVSDELRKEVLAVVKRHYKVS